MKIKLPSSRFAAIDALRGLAMVWMTVFHFCFDLNHLGYIRQNFYDDPLWTWQRTCILSLFLAAAGLSQAIALQQGQSWSQFWRRWGQVAGCAMLVTLGSLWMYPRSFIYFGTLHGIAAMLIVVRLSAGAGYLDSLNRPMDGRICRRISRPMSSALWLLGGLAIATQFVAAYAVANSGHADLAAALNSRSWNWLGIITVKPVTEDYVPLLPWLGVMVWGVAAGQWLLANRLGWLAWQPSDNGVAAQAFSRLAALGRWSLLYYLLHQPVMMGLLSAWRWCTG